MPSLNDEKLLKLMRDKIKDQPYYLNARLNKFLLRKK